jgi:hypothetical protein
LNPGRRGGKPATNRLSYGAAYNAVSFWLFSRQKVLPIATAKKYIYMY